MNCAFHNELAAVAACQNCSVGLCNECIDKGLRIDNKPTCKKCSLEYINTTLDELDTEKAKIKTRKIIWTIILVLGAAFVIYDFFINPDGKEGLFLVGFFIWGLAGF